MKPKTEKPPRLSLILNGVASLTQQQDCDIFGMTSNSKEVCAGTLFVALSGIRHHGADFIPEAIAAGAVAVLCEQTDTLGDLSAYAVPVIIIEDLSHQLGWIASSFFGHPSRAMTMVGVTGTNGKTTCTQLLAQVLSNKSPCGVIGTLGYGLYGALVQGGHTTPNAIEIHRILADLRDAGATHVVMEVSSHGLDQGRVEGVVFDIALFTNLSRDHLDYHGDMQRYGRAKQRLFVMPGLKYAVINTDDAFGRALLRDLTGYIGLSAYSLELTSGLPENPLVSGSELTLTRNGLQMLVRDPGGSVTIKSSLLGRFNAANLLAIYGVLLWLGLSRNLIAARLGKCVAVPGRMECFTQPGLPLVVVDYAHTPDALEQALEALREHCDGKLWCLFGCGGERDSGKRPLMGAIAECHADKVILTNDNPRDEDAARVIVDILGGIKQKERVKVIADRAEAIGYAIANASAGDVILIAGKGHEDYQIVAGETVAFSDSQQVIEQLAARLEQA